MNSMPVCATEARPAPCLNRRPKAILIDLAGVLHVGEYPLPGAVEALSTLRAAGLPLRFLTNTTRSPRDRLVAQLQAMGFPVAAGEIQTAVHAAIQRVRQLGLHPHYLVHSGIAGEVGESHPQPDVVVLGDVGPELSFDALNHAFRLLMQGLPLIAMARNRYFQESDGVTLDMGALVAALEFGSGVTAEVVGKPAPPFFLGAQAVHIPGVLVRTGKYRPQDERDDGIVPTAIVDDFAAAVRLLLALPP